MNLKRTKFLLGITLLAQAASYFMMFILLCTKKKSLSKAILTVALAGGIAGVCLLCLDSSEEFLLRRARLKQNHDSDEDYDPELYGDEIYDEDIDDCQC